MGFGDFLKNAWGATEKEAKEGLAAASHAISAAEKDAEAAADAAKAAAGQAIATAKKDVADAAKAAEQEANKIAAEAKSEAQKAIASAERDAEKLGTAAKNQATRFATALKSDALKVIAATEHGIVKAAAAAVAIGRGVIVAVRAAVILSQVPTSIEAQALALIYNKVSQAFSSDPIDNITADCPIAASLANATRLSDAVKADNQLIEKAKSMGLENDPSVKALQNVVDTSAKALMSADVYGPYNPTPQVDIPGYKRMSPDEINKLLDSTTAASKFDTESPNFHAALYASVKSPTVYTLAFRGTQEKVDWVTNAENGLGVESGAYKSAVALAQEVKSAVKHAGGTLEVTGHSLGGGLAQAASSVTGAKGAIFNAAAFNPMSVPNFNGRNPEQNLVNYHVAGEPLTTAQIWNIGMPGVAARQAGLPAPPNAGLLDLHSMNSVETGLVSSGRDSQSAVSKLVGGP